MPPDSAVVVEAHHTRNDFGTTLRALRRGAGLTLRALSARAAVTHVTLSYWETGKTRPRIHELNSVLLALNAGEADRQALLGSLDTPRAARELRQTEGGLSAPIIGDLIWAMRLRKSWTQAEAASAVGVHQTQIARWENGDSWPDADKLHALCWHMGALPEEVAALTTALPYGHNKSAHFGPVEMDCPRNSTDADEWRGFLGALMFDMAHPFNLLDLTMLGIERRLTEQAERYPFAAALLPTAYAVHARRHMNHGHLRQARHWAAQGMAAAQREKSRGNLEFARAGYSLWFGNVIVCAAHRASADTRPAKIDGARLLRQWLPLLPADDGGHRAWGLSSLARLIAEAGYLKPAIMISQEASRPELSADVMNYLHRQVDHARLLIRVGDFRSALELLEPCHAMDPLVQADPDSDVRLYLMEAECLIGLGDPKSAENRLRTAEAECVRAVTRWKSMAEPDNVAGSWWLGKLAELQRSIDQLLRQPPTLRK